VNAVIPQVKPQAMRTIAHADGSRPRVLYAEDQATSRIVTKAMLERMGLEVDAVEDGEVALTLASQCVYDIILLDIEMPVMDGVAAARGIRALGGDKARTPILALSAFLADSTEQSQWRGAFDRAIPKPANGNELHDAIHAALAGVRVETAKPDALGEGLKATLGAGAWQRFVCMAAGEAVHYANVAEAAFNANDRETLRRCLHSLRGLAVNFGADELAMHVWQMQQGTNDAHEVSELARLALAWRGNAS
jgi:CheY-like chemotaxis protein